MNALVKAIEELIGALQVIKQADLQAFAGTPEDRLLKTLLSAMESYKRDVAAETQ